MKFFKINGLTWIIQLLCIVAAFGLIFTKTDVTGKYIYCLLSSAALFSFVIISKNKGDGGWRQSFLLIYFAIYAIITTGYYIANYFSGAGINFEVLSFLNWNSLSAVTYALEYYQMIGLAIFLLFVCVYALGFLKKSITRKSVPALVYFAAGILSLVIHPLLISVYDLSYLRGNAKLSQAAVESIDKSALSQSDLAHIRSEVKVLPNVLMIFLEGIEKTYSNDKYFKGLVTDLADITSQNVDFSNVRMAWGTNHTIAGMIGSLCGVPENTPLGGMVQNGETNVYMPNAQCLGDITKALGYTNLFYQGARLNFTNKGGFMSAHGFDEVRGMHDLSRQLQSEDQQGPWGLHDDFLLSQVETRLDELLSSETTQPFFFTMLTLDTHDVFGKGRYSQWCSENNVDDYPAADHPIQHQVMCSDKLVSSFIRRIHQKYGDKLTIVLTNDHYTAYHSIGEKLKTAQKNRDRRMFFSIISSDEPKQSIPRDMTTIDVGATVIDYITQGKIKNIGMGVSGFAEQQKNLLENMGEENLASYLKTTNLALGKKLWKIPSFKETDILISEDQQTLSIGDHKFHLPVALLLDRSGSVVDFYTDRFFTRASLLKGPPRMIVAGKYNNVKDLIKYDGKDENTIVSVGNLGSDKFYTKAIDSDFVLTYQMCAEYLNTPVDNKVLNDRLYIDSQDPKFSKIKYVGTEAVDPYALIDIRSSMGMTSNLVSPQIFPSMKYMLHRTDDIKRDTHGKPSKSGLFLFKVNKGKLEKVHHWQTCSDQQEFRTMRDVLKEQESSRWFVLVSANGANCGKDLQPVFNDSPFESAANIGYLQPYVAYWDRETDDAVSVTDGGQKNVMLRLINKQLLEKKYR